MGCQQLLILPNLISRTNQIRKLFSSHFAFNEEGDDKQPVQEINIASGGHDSSILQSIFLYVQVHTTRRK